MEGGGLGLAVGSAAGRPVGEAAVGASVQGAPRGAGEDNTDGGAWRQRWSLQ